MTTLLPVPAGMVHVFGYDAADDRMAARRLLGYVPQQLSADASPTGRENVALFARALDVPRRERAERVGRPPAAVGLSDAADRLAGTCSGGMVRRLELAQALVSAAPPADPRRTGPRPGPDRPHRRVGADRRRPRRHRHDGPGHHPPSEGFPHVDEADQSCDRVAREAHGPMHGGRIPALGNPTALREGPGARRHAAGAADTDPLPALEDVFRNIVGSGLDESFRRLLAAGPAGSLILVRDVMCGTWLKPAVGSESGFFLPTA
jgi:ABC-2 type transport system ATP-binding protein